MLLLLVFIVIIYKIFVIVCPYVLRHTCFDVCTAVIISVKFSNMGYVHHLRPPFRILLLEPRSWTVL
jgi:hypothetical protein